ncbi:MAG: hypothetical protein E7250_22725 [Paenibacillaceae bacterium]|nr:hypothetical protein [Paenibacillaceae bacterium]
MAVKKNYDDFKKTLSSFYVDKDLEKDMEKKQDIMIYNIKKKLKNVDTVSGLETYIKNEKDSLQNLTSVLGVSEERFRRIVSMIRRMNKDYFSSEWTISAIRNKMIKDKKYMDTICDLMINGKSKSLYTDKIPKFILEQVVIDTKRLKMLTTKSALKQFIKPSFEGIYSNAVGDKVETILEKEISAYCIKHGTTYVHEKNVSWIDRNIDFIIPSVDNPKILIEVSYMVTTGSGQTTKQRDEHQTRLKIDDYNRRNRKDVKFVNFIDGAGWLGRQRDLKLMFDDSDFVINLKNINDLDGIIKEYSK